MQRAYALSPETSLPSEMLKAHLNIDRQMAMKIPAEKLYLV
jgi:hypothetical protein